MSGAKDSLANLERHRLQLEENVKKLQKAVQHWQAWDVEYEALKEEIDALPSADSKSLRRFKESLESELLKKADIDEVFGIKSLKSKSQITGVLERRIDYVTQNIKTLQKQLEAAENKYAAVTVIAQPDAVDEDGDPITDIIEELDEEDNVVNYKLTKPGEAIPRITEALERVGIDDIPKPEPETKPSSKTKSQDARIKESVVEKLPEATQPVEKTLEVVKSETPSQKGISFAPDTKASDSPKPHVSRNAKRVEAIMKTAKEQEDAGIEKPVIPEDDDEDDAELRRQMLAYNMGEVGSVVAELELVEGDTDEEDYEFEYSDEGFEDDEDDHEDKYGRDTESLLTDGYRKRMLELEKRLGVKSRFTAAEEAREAARAAAKDDAESSSDGEGIGRIVVKRSEAPSSASKPAPAKSNIKEKQVAETGGKKGVRFASSLDVAPDAPAAPVVEEVTEKEHFVEPLGDIVERSGPTKVVQAKPSRKASRFKKSRGETPLAQGPMDMPVRFLDQDRPIAPTGPKGTTIADRLVERPTVAPREEGDDDMIHEQVADEYQRLRRKFIQREGGFLKENESPIQPLDEAEGGRETVSRFKSARLSRQ